MIKAQIDLAIGADANAIRIIGGPNAVTEGAISRATYLARQAQVLDYCAANGLWYYPCALGDYEATLTGPLVDEVVAFAALLADYPDTVYGLDIVNEFHLYRGVNSGTWATHAAFAADMGTVVPQIRAVAPDLLLTFSCDIENVDEVAHLIDFADVHLWGEGLSAATVETYIRNLALPFVVFGEFGATAAADTATRQAAYQRAVDHATLAMSSGAFVWAIQDGSTDPATQYGLFDATGTLRTDVAPLFGGLPSSGAP